MSTGRAVLLASCYILGSIPTGYWLGKLWKGVDVRQFGSGNLGATNVFRVLGVIPGVFTLGIDIMKGLAAVMIAKHFFPSELSTSIYAGAAAILGHTTSVFVRFRGGKGVATSAGVFLALLPMPSAAALTAFVVVFSITRYVSLGSLIGAYTLAAMSFVLSAPPALSWAAVAIALFVTWTHRTNIRRLAQGTENRILWSRTS